MDPPLPVAGPPTRNGFRKLSGSWARGGGERALQGRRPARNGIDPIATRKGKGVPTFGELADQVARDLADGFRNEKHKAQWMMTIKVYAAPLREKPVQRPGKPLSVMALEMALRRMGIEDATVHGF